MTRPTSTPGSRAGPRHIHAAFQLSPQQSRFNATGRVVGRQQSPHQEHPYSGRVLGRHARTRPTRNIISNQSFKRYARIAERVRWQFPRHLHQLNAALASTRLESNTRPVQLKRPYKLQYVSSLGTAAGSTTDFTSTTTPPGTSNSRYRPSGRAKNTLCGTAITRPSSF